MNEGEHPGGSARGDEVPEEGDAVNISDGRTEYPALGPNADVVHDDESQARRPEDTDPSEEEMDGDSNQGGTPPGTTIRGG